MKRYFTFPEWISQEIIPGFPLIKWNALLYLMAFGFTIFLFSRQIKKNKIKTGEDDTINLFFWCSLGMLLGARIFYIFVYDPAYNIFKEPLNFLLHIFWPFDRSFHFIGISGMSYFGGLIGASFVFILFCAINKIDILQWGDFLAAAFSFGYIFCRIGSFTDGKPAGKITTFIGGMIFPQVPADKQFSAGLPWVRTAAKKIGLKIQDGGMVNFPRHPVQLYEALLGGVVLWIILWFIFGSRRIFKGFKIAVYFIGYGLFRFLIEYFREPDAQMGYVLSFTHQQADPFSILWLNFTINHVFSASMVFVGLVFLFFSGIISGKKSSEPPSVI